MLALEQRFSYLEDKPTKKIRDFLKEFKNIKGGKCKRTFKSWKETPQTSGFIDKGVI